jgi:hypothetical protein
LRRSVISAPEKAKNFEVFTPALTRPAGCAQTISHLQIPLAIEINYSAAGVFNWLGILRAFNGFLGQFRQSYFIKI